MRTFLHFPDGTQIEIGDEPIGKVYLTPGKLPCIEIDGQRYHLAALNELAYVPGIEGPIQVWTLEPVPGTTN